MPICQDAHERTRGFRARRWCHRQFRRERSRQRRGVPVLDELLVGIGRFQVGDFAFQLVERCRFVGGQIAAFRLRLGEHRMLFGHLGSLALQEFHARAGVAKTVLNDAEHC